MSIELIKYAFIAGEISPTLFGRTDLTKYDLGVAQAQNWFVDYRGGISTRPGTEFCDFVYQDTEETKFVQFRFSPDLANTYVVLFGHNYVRFIQDGAYVLEANKTITAIAKGTTTTVTSNAHGYTNGQWVKIFNVAGMTELNGRTFQVVGAATNTFRLIDLMTGAELNSSAYGTYTSGGNAARIYTVTSPYAGDDLAALGTYQIRDTIRLTHPDFPIKNLTRNGHTSWTLTDESIGNPHPAPGGVTVAASATGSASVAYSVSAVFSDGAEGIISLPVRASSIVNFTTTAGSVTVSWNPVAGAEYYIVYRTHVVPTGTKISAGAQMGFLGSTKSTFFVDGNIIPDFSKTPYEHYNPFAPGFIESVTVTAPGSGYDFRATLSISGPPGSGFSGYGIVDESGGIANVAIRNRGKNYEAPLTVSFPSGGATATATISPDDGIYPAISALFQQRQVYAATYNQPLTIWASQIKRYNIFDTSQNIIDSDSYEFEIDSAEIAPLLHMFPTRGGLLLMSQTGIWLLSGGPSAGAVTPSNALADPQSYTGVSPVYPVKVGSDILYIEGKGYAVRVLTYNEFSKLYSGEDKSILSSHLFNSTKQIVRWAFAENPHKVVWGVRSDGAIVMFTIVREQDVYAWTWGDTKGQFTDVIAVQENDYDRVYFTVRRYINGQWRKFVERVALRDFDLVEDAWAVDAGLKLEPPAINTTLAFGTPYSEDILPFVDVTAGSAVFTGMEQAWIRSSGGVFVVNQVLSPTTAKLQIISYPTDILPQDGRIIGAAANDWTMATPVNTLRGLWHLEGETVQILGDGSVFPTQVVTNGQITLPDGVTKAIVGLKYNATIRTLPPTVPDTAIEARRKRTVGMAVRLYESRGLLEGLDLDNLYELRERTTEPYGTPVRTQTGIRYKMLPTQWQEDAQTYFVVEDPLPVTILGLVPDIEVGDDTD